MGMLEKAIQIAAEAHAGQRGRDGLPYILHPLRVMLEQKDDPARIVAMLHDLVERTDWTLADLENEGFSQQLVDAVDAMTLAECVAREIPRRDGEDYHEFVRRAGSNAIASTVKIADLKDNLRTAIENSDGERSEKYENALAVLLG